MASPALAFQTQLMQPTAAQAAPFLRLDSAWPHLPTPTRQRPAHQHPAPQLSPESGDVPVLSVAPSLPLSNGNFADFRQIYFFWDAIGGSLPSRPSAAIPI